MSTLSFRRAKSKTRTFGAVRNVLDNELRRTGADLFQDKVARGVIGLESLNESLIAEAEHDFSTVEQLVASAYSDAGFDGELTDAQKEAGALTIMAKADPSGYAKAATTVKETVSTEGLRVVDPIMSGLGGALDFRSAPAAGLEAFDEQEVSKFLPESVIFNVQAARQSAFAELFYKTIVVSPDQPGLDISVRRPLVFNEVRRTTAGDTRDFEKRNLLDGVIDHRILENEAIKAVPAVVENGAGANTDKFVDSAKIAAYDITVDGDTFKTAPLKIGTDLNLIDLSGRPGLIAAGVMDSTDNLDGSISLEKIYLEVTAAAVGEDDPVTSYIPFDVARMPYSGFVKSVEGNYRKMVLHFETDMLTLTGATEDQSGAPADALAYLADPARKEWFVRLHVELTGTANLEFGTIKVSSVNTSIHSVWVKDSEGKFVQLGSTELAAVKAAIPTLSVIGYDVRATRTNTNRRVRGLLLDTTEEVERFPILMGSPLSIPAPVNSQNDGSHITTLVQAARIRNTNNAITQLLNYSEMLSNAVVDNDRTRAIQSIEGAGRWLVRPFYQSKDLDLAAEINSLTSAERQADVSAALVNCIREIAYRMAVESGYKAALEAMTGGAETVPHLAIGCDPVLANHLQLTGDTRTAGIAFTYTVVSDLDSRLKNKIFLTFVRPGAEGADILSFGNHVWVPELVTTVQVSRGGATTKELQVQPRNRHVNHLPILAVINVQNLAQAVASGKTLSVALEE